MFRRVGSEGCQSRVAGSRDAKPIAHCNGPSDIAEMAESIREMKHVYTKRASFDPVFLKSEFLSSRRQIEAVHARSPCHCSCEAQQLREFGFKFPV